MEPRVIQIASLWGGQAGRIYNPNGLSPTITTPTGGNHEPLILLDMEEKEIIPYNTPEDGVAPTITTMYARLGTNNLTPGEYGGAMGIMEVKSCASRKRGDEHKIETRNDEVANCVTSIDTDSMIAEPKVLTPLRTEEGRKLCKQGIDKFGNRALYPREDGVSNTITTVQHDNLLQEPKIVGYSRDSKGNITCHHLKDVANTIHTCTGSGRNTDQYVAEGTEYKGKFMKYGDAVDTSRSETFGTHVMDGVSPTLRSERPDANAVCVKDGIDYKGKFIKEGDGLYTDTTDDFFRGGLDGVSRTLKAETHDAGTVVRQGARYRIRKLTPIEVGRLMNVDDTDIQKMIDAGISKTGLYKLFGNSIVVNVLYHIFRKMFIETECEEQQLSLF